MKKIALFFMSMLLVCNLAAQRTVQGIARPELKTSNMMTLSNSALDTTFSFNDIKFWVGEGTNQAALVLSWHDGSTTNPDHIVWGYQWPTNETRTGLDMIKAIAQADSRLLILIQNTGSLGYTINGIGYDTDPSNLDVIFDLDGAEADTRFSFTYPSMAQDIADDAISEGLVTGIIEHPFEVGEGITYPAYDYDYWSVDKVTYPNTHWYAGWYNGYWSYFTRDAKNQNWEYSNWGASSRPLTNGTWDAWSYNADMNNWEGTRPGYPLVAATYAPRTTVNPIQTTNVDAKAIYSLNELRLQHMKGYTGYISSVYGNTVETFTITSDNQTKSLNLASGIYTFTGVKGNEKVSLKFVVK